MCKATRMETAFPLFADLAVVSFSWSDQEEVKRLFEWLVVLGSVPRALWGHVNIQMPDINTLRALFLPVGSGITRSGVRKKYYFFLTVALTLFETPPATSRIGRLKLHSTSKCLDLLWIAGWTTVQCNMRKHCSQLFLEKTSDTVGDLKYSLRKLFADSIVNHHLSNISDIASVSIRYWTNSTQNTRYSFSVPIK